MLYILKLFLACCFVISNHNNNYAHNELGSELPELCKTFKLVISTYNVYGRESGQYTYYILHITYYVMDSHFFTSWLDHLICSHDMNLKLGSVKVLNKLPCSHHLPLSAEL